MALGTPLYQPLVNRPLPCGPGLPFAYDPLWRYQTISTANGTQGYYMGDTYEARFGYGLTTIRPDSDGGPPSAHGLQRITNFNRPYVQSGNAQIPIMPASIYVPNIFVSQEDVVWQDPNANNYTINGQQGGTSVTGPSPLLPDLSPPTGVTNGGSASLDWRYSWMFTGQLNSASNLSCFDGNIVIFENRQFGIRGGHRPVLAGGELRLAELPGRRRDGRRGGLRLQHHGHHAGRPAGPGGPGYGSAADRTVLLRWSTSMPDPVVRPGDWIADVTYERQQPVVLSRFLSWPQANPNLRRRPPELGQQARVGQPAGAAVLLVPGPEGRHPGRPTPRSPAIARWSSSSTRTCVSRTVLNTSGQPRVPERRPDRPQRHQRHPADDFYPLVLLSVVRCPSLALSVAERVGDVAG